MPGNRLDEVFVCSRDQHAIGVACAGALNIRPNCVRELSARQSIEASWSQLTIESEFDWFGTECVYARRYGLSPAE
jgi:hypothetical protein